MLPVVAIWGQRWGLAIKATTAMPEAVLIGFAISRGWRRVLYSSGIADMISTSLGSLGQLFFDEISFFT
jgi:hypothetical protein